MIIEYFTIWMLIICCSIVVQCFPTAHHGTILRPHPAPQFHALPIARYPPTAAPMFLVPRPAVPRPDVAPSSQRLMKHYPVFAVPITQPSAMMMPRRSQMQPVMVGGPAPMMAAPNMMQQQPMMAPSVYPFNSIPHQYYDYDKKDDEDEEDEYAKPVNLGQVGLSFGIGGVNEPGATGESTATTPFPFNDMLSGLMGGVAKIVQADAQKEMMGNMMKMMMLSSLVDM